MNLEQLVPWLAGFLGIPITQWFKTLLGVTGGKALWLTAGVSFLLAIIALLITGGGLDALLDPASVFEATAKIMTVATLIYKTIVSTT